MPINEFFDPTDPDTGDNVGAWVRSSTGDLITHTDVGSKNLLDVNAQFLAGSVGSLSIDKNFTTQSFSASASYQTVYSYTGSGALIGFNIHPNSDKLQVELDIDGMILFNGMSISDIFQALGQVEAAFNGNWFSVGNKSRYLFSPSQPVPFSTSLTIKAKKSNDAMFDIQDYIVILTKET